MQLLADAALARRIERAEGAISAAFVEALAARHAAGTAERPAWLEHAGARALYAGVDSPMTQSFGFGLFAPPSAADLDVLEAFFATRGAAPAHEVSPLAGAGAYALLAERGYRPSELTTVLVRALADLDDAPGGATSGGLDLDDAPGGATTLAARLVEPDEADAWVEASAAGWAERVEMAAHVRSMARTGFESRAVSSFAVEAAGRIVATGALGVHDGIALLAGASTLPAYRGRGAQRALLVARLRQARRGGCDVALMGAEPGSGSQRNAERSGFRVAYTRLKWALASLAPGVPADG